MRDSNIDRERAVVNSFMELYKNEEERENGFPLLEEKIFTDRFTRAVVKNINSLIQNHDYCDQMAIEGIVKRLEGYSDMAWLDLIATQWLTKKGLDFHLGILKQNYVDGII